MDSITLLLDIATHTWRIFSSVCFQDCPVIGFFYRWFLYSWDLVGEMSKTFPNGFVCCCETNTLLLGQFTHILWRALHYCICKCWRFSWLLSLDDLLLWLASSADPVCLNFCIKYVLLRFGSRVSWNFNKNWTSTECEY